jgi:hypothetical protein
MPPPTILDGPTNVWRQKNARKVPHPASNSDLAASDFFLFGFRKEKVRAIALTAEDELISRIRAIFNEMPESVVMAVELTCIK